MKYLSKFGTALLLVALMLSIMPAATQPAQAATCYWAQFIADVTVPDGTNYAPGASFRKTWRLKNIGTCSWNSSDVSLIFDSGERMGAPTSSALSTTVNPGQTVDISVDMTAPSTAGHYFGYYKFKSNSGGVFGIGSTANKSFWVEINVNSTSGTGYDFTTNAGSAAWSSGAGVLSFPGSDGSANGFALKKDRPKFENGIESAQAGLLFVPNNVNNGYIQAIYPAFRVQSGDRFQATIGCEYGATTCYVAYRLDYQIGSGAVRTFWTFREKYEGLSYNANLDLSSLAGQDVKFILVISAFGTPSGDRALWGNPIIARAGGTPPPPPPTGNKYDFGTSSSPVASGYLRVTEATAYSAGSFGWTDLTGLESRDRSALADDLKRDLVLSSSAARNFKVDLANGSYSVSVTMGDNDFAHDNMVVKANGTTVLADVDSATAGFAVNTFSVTVSSGNLALEFSDSGGSDPTWVVNTLSITSSTPPTSQPPANCDRAQFISDVTVPDGTSFAPGFVFSKTWRLKNVGTCTWTNYSLMFDSGEKMSGPDAALIPTSVAPGQTVDITISLTSPTTAGTYRGYWKLKNNNGVPFGIGSGGTKSFWVEIKVSGTGIVPTTPVTPSTPATPIAGTIYDFVANVCAATWYTGAGQQPCPGTDGDARGFVLITNPSRLETGTNDNRTGLITFPQNVENGYIQGFYPAYRVRAGDKFRGTVNCEGGATACRVVFRLDYVLVGSSTIQTHWAFVEKYDSPPQFYNADIDLSTLVGLDVKFILTVLSTGSPVGDRALWVAPHIFNAGSLTPIPPTATFTPTRTPTATGTVPTSTSTATPTATATIPAASYKYDFGTASSPLAATFTRITEMSVYAPGSAGWIDASGLESRDRSAPADDLKRDFVTHASLARSFKVDLPNGNYTVSVTMGDNDYAHDNMVVKANGTTVLADVDNVAGVFTVNTFAVTVSAGSLTLEFSEAGGVEPSWVVNTLTITTP